MKSKMVVPKKNRAQAMVEFAIALPILLMLLYGILEAGRLLFLYSTIVTASRQAVRYGSATGVGTGGVPRYQDCAGIRAAANRADFLNSFDDSDIVITYDDGPGTAGTDPSTDPPTVPPWRDICDGDGTVDTDVTPSTANTTRINVTIRGDFFPIVPKLVPFIERSRANNDPILGESARTILVAVSIIVTDIPSPFVEETTTSTPTPSPTPTDTPTRTPTNTATNTPVFTNTATRTPTRTFTPTITLSPTITNTPTLTVTPTSIPTGVTGCNAITHGATITTSGNTLTLTISSPVPAPVQIQDIFVVWNHDKGHNIGSKRLVLNAVSLAGQFWSGASSGPNQSVTPSPISYIPTGNSTLTFTFDQSYDFLDGTEEILINLSTPGCTGFPIHATN